MDNTKLAQHEITAAKMWREVGNVDRALQHLEYALAYLQDDKAAQPLRAVDVANVCPNCETKWQFHDPRVCTWQPPRN
jgi:hypothetical protein